MLTMLRYDRGRRWWGGRTKREERKHRERQRRKQGRGGRQEDRGGQRKPVGAQEDCDHASWISISKQNKYPPSLLLLVRSSHKPFQVPCRPFPHRDLYLLASSLLGSPSLSLISSAPPSAAFFHPLVFLLHFSPQFSSSRTSLTIKFFFFGTSLRSSDQPSLSLSLCFSVSTHKSTVLSLSRRQGGGLAEEVVLVASIKTRRGARSVGTSSGRVPH